MAGRPTYLRWKNKPRHSCQPGDVGVLQDASLNRQSLSMWGTIHKAMLEIDFTDFKRRSMGEGKLYELRRNMNRFAEEKRQLSAHRKLSKIRY